ncbi:hypothetical protein BJX62DRAFT_218926 [Aspergillus germanicus]
MYPVLDSLSFFYLSFFSSRLSSPFHSTPTSFPFLSIFAPPSSPSSLSCLSLPSSSLSPFTIFSSFSSSLLHHLHSLHFPSPAYSYSYSHPHSTGPHDTNRPW